MDLSIPSNKWNSKYISRSAINRTRVDTSIPHTRLNNDTDFSKLYEIGNEIGKGSYGTVLKITERANKAELACKVVIKERAGSSGIRLLEREVKILKTVQHAFIITLKAIFETKNKMFIITELCNGGDLYSFIRKKIFSANETKIVTGRLCEALSYLHSRDMVHRDIKLENVLLGTNPQDEQDPLYVKITDFGLSIVKGGSGVEDMLVDFCGTPTYMPPEIINGKSYNEKCDIWSLGIIVYTLFVGKHPFDVSKKDSLYNDICTFNIVNIMCEKVELQRISDAAKNCLSLMLHQNTAHRITAAEILRHPWITGEKFDEKKANNILDLMKQWKNEKLQQNTKNPQDENVITKSAQIVKKQISTSTDYQKRKSDNSHYNTKMYTKLNGTKNDQHLRIHQLRTSTLSYKLLNTKVSTPSINKKQNSNGKSDKNPDKRV